TGIGNTWPTVFAAINTLGVLRASAARDSIEAVLKRSGAGTFVHGAATAALASLDRPPCADSAGPDLQQTLIAVVMRCRPQAMWPTKAYRDATTKGTWTF